MNQMLALELFFIFRVAITWMCLLRRTSVFVQLEPRANAGLFSTADQLGCGCYLRFSKKLIILGTLIAKGSLRLGCAKSAPKQLGAASFQCTLN
jgi:hypothetical protein